MVKPPMGRTFILSVLSVAIVWGAGASGEPLSALAQTTQSRVHKSGDFLWLGAGSIIVAEGDSLTYGQDESPEGHRPPINGASQGRSVTPFPDALATHISACARVLNRGFPGDRSIDGLLRWQNAPNGDVAILMYGTNDAINFAGHPTGRVNVATYRMVLSDLVRRRQSAGTAVIVLTPPPLGDAENERMLVPFRGVAKDVAQANATLMLDTSELLRSLSHPWTDNVHLTSAAYQLIGDRLGTFIKCE